jgi:hypothetical protein
MSNDSGREGSASVTGPTWKCTSDKPNQGLQLLPGAYAVLRPLAAAANLVSPGRHFAARVCTTRISGSGFADGR